MTSAKTYILIALLKVIIANIKSSNNWSHWGNLWGFL